MINNVVRKAKLEDLEQLALLFDSYRVFYRKKTDINAAKAFILDRLKNEDSVIFVAEHGIQLTGFTQLYPLFSSTNMKRVWLLNDLYVNESARGKGISIQLINAAKNLATETKAHGIMLETEKSNNIGNQLYPKVGFKLNDKANFYEWNCS